MGEVYRGRGTRLGREIAMELVEGATLRQLLSGGRLSTARTLSVGSRIAAALARAHGSNIVQRDLKPENVMVTPEGLVKVLDFGLACSAPERGESSRGDTATRQTGAGVVFGTVGYMSPEQATGQAVDRRSDQFALGAILYEMVSGRRAFRRATPLETLSAILKEEPEPLSAVEPATPEAFARPPSSLLSTKGSKRASGATRARSPETPTRRAETVRRAARGCLRGRAACVTK